MATIALFVAIGGGAYAAFKLPKNSVGRAQLKRNAVVSAKVADGSLLAKDFKAGQLPAGRPGVQGVQGPKGDPGAPNPDAQTLQGHPASDFLSSSRLLVSGQVTASNPSNSTAVEKPLISNGTFSLFGECERNNVGTLQTEVWMRATQAGSYLDSFGNGTDGALARSASIGPGQIGVLAVVPNSRYDTRSFVAVAPNGATMTGTVSSGTGVIGDCVFSAVAVQ